MFGRATLRLVPALSALAVVAGLTVGAVGCSTSGRELDPPAALPADAGAEPGTGSIAPLVTGEGGFEVRASTFQPGEQLPDTYRSDGQNLVPPLEWANVPAGATDLAVVLRDADAADEVYWVVTGIPAERAGLTGGLLPAGAVTHPNDFGEADYRGPTAPVGDTHRFVYTVYVFDDDLELAPDLDAASSVLAIENAAVTSSAILTTVTGG